jgi:hypothetical protein
MDGNLPLILFLLPTCWGISVAIGKMQRVASPHQGIFWNCRVLFWVFFVDLSSFESLTSKVIDPQHSLVLVAMLSWLVAPGWDANASKGWAQKLKPLRLDSYTYNIVRHEPLMTTNFNCTCEKL